MTAVAAAAGIALILLVLWEGFETIVLPRRVTRQIRLTRLFYRATWKPWAAILGIIASPKRRETYLGYYGPLSLLGLLAVWAVTLVLGFALVLWGFGSHINSASGAVADFWTDLYMSGTTFFTLGLGDVTPQGPLARLLTVVESGTGFAFLAMVIGYLPTLYQAFSRREVNITLLDARAGSPPSAVELLRRHARDHGPESLVQLLRDWERWSAELLESHLSYPVLCYFRSQHDNENWLASLTTILDTCALVRVGVENVSPAQAQLTFAIARHAVVDLAQIFSTPPDRTAADRLPPEQLAELRRLLAEAGCKVQEGSEAEQKLTELRAMYEPYVQALAGFLRFTLPGWLPPQRLRDNWQTSAWERGSGGIASPPCAQARKDDHF
ncbi:MAG TPA: potassium channel family protein [Terriglobales bacterium]|nr:potassium channel family protein [Terriglobales bacterium]